jgi:hypothetical protein
MFKFDINMANRKLAKFFGLYTSPTTQRPTFTRRPTKQKNIIREIL